METFTVQLLTLSEGYGLVYNHNFATQEVFERLNNWLLFHTGVVSLFPVAHSGSVATDL